MDEGEFRKKKKEKAAVRGRQQSSQGTPKQISLCDARGCGGYISAGNNAQIWKHLQSSKSSIAQLSTWWSLSEETLH